MGTTADKLALLMASKEAIRDAITEKTGEDAGDVMSAYAEKILAIEGGTRYYRTTILIDQTITDPATMITKVYDDGGLDQIRVNSHRYVCKLVDGVMQAKQLQDNNSTLYLDGTTADLTGAEGDVMMKLPQFYYNATEQETDKWLITFVYGEKPSEEFKEWDGKDFIGVYEAYIADSNVYSRSGVESAYVSLSDFKTYARNRGAGYTLVKWKHHCIMAALFFANYLNTNSQNICGAGTDSNAKITGQTNLLGMEDTNAQTNGNSQSINFFGLENWWGNKFEGVDNIVVNDRVWSITEDDDSVRQCSANAASGYVGKMLLGPKLDMICAAIGGSATTGYADYYYQSSTTGRAVFRGGNASAVQGGIVSINADEYPSLVSSDYGSRLAYRGEYEEYNGVFDAEYIKVKSLYINGSKYLDTGFIPNQDTRVVLDATFSEPSVISWIFGARDTLDAAYGFVYVTGSKVWRTDYGTSRIAEAPDQITHIDHNKNVITINNSKVINHTYNSFTAKYSLMLFANNEVGSPYAPISGEIRSCQIYDNDILIRDYIPCIRKYDGAQALWDEVNKTITLFETIE